MPTGKKHGPKAKQHVAADDEAAAPWTPEPVRFTVSPSPLDDPQVRTTLLSRPPPVLTQLPAQAPAGSTPREMPNDGELEPASAIVERELPPQEENLHARLRPAMLIIPPARTTQLPDEAPLLLALYVNGIERPQGPWLSLGPGARERIIGRARGLSLSLDDATLSRRHASVTGGPDGWELRDLGSTCGTFVNGVRVSHARLRDGDRVRLGGVILRALLEPPFRARVALIREDMKVVDVLTGLATSRGFRAVLDALPDRAEAVAGWLVLVALDSPEAIKAAHGDVILDEVLVALAARLRGLFPKHATGARMWDGHFAWWVESARADGVQAFAQRVTEGVAAEPLALPERSLRVTVSVRASPVGRGASEGVKSLEGLRARLRGEAC